MRRNKRIMLCVFMFIQAMYFHDIHAYPSSIENEVFVEDNLCETKAFGNSSPNKKASLILQMAVKKHSSGVVYALDLELLNNTNKNIAFIIPTNITEVFTTIITLNNEDQQQISQNLKKYVIDGREKQKFDEYFIKAGEKKKWLLNMMDVLQTNETVKKALINDSEGRLRVFFSFRYFLDADGCNKEYRRGEISYMQDEHFSLESYFSPK